MLPGNELARCCRTVTVPDATGNIGNVRDRICHQGRQSIGHLLCVLQLELLLSLLILRKKPIFLHDVPSEALAVVRAGTVLPEALLIALLGLFDHLRQIELLAFERHVEHFTIVVGLGDWSVLNFLVLF